MKLLAIETATDACSVALWIDGMVHQRHQVAPRQHADLVLADIDALIAETDCRLGDLDGIAFGRGPGSFTGVRIATALTQGIAFGADLPVAPVSTLQALAQGVLREQRKAERVLAAFDARLGEVYYAQFVRAGNGLARLQGAEELLAPDQVTLPDETNWYAAGSGFSACDGALAERLQATISNLDAERLPQAQDVAILGAALLEAGEGVSAQHALPVYLREQVARKPGQ